jgi:regulator of G-protein signaling
MHQVRRRKRRSQGGSATTPLPNLRCVDVERGAYGFGFTISGQQPCLLSCIVPGSPAETAGLQPGHALVAVNGRNVARLPHDTVVRLIGSSCGRLR